MENYLWQVVIQIPIVFIFIWFSMKTQKAFMDFIAEQNKQWSTAIHELAKEISHLRREKREED